mmetsp:Transcript_14808/g.29715  ORF Transcript_14808/g.29715 Transcript_14808/m.29715 type:complete len:173 (+) Transcript_14808:254-772(+)
MTSTMLDRFQVNGAQPLLESRVREMIQCQHDARWLRAWDLQPLEEKLNLELVWSVEERNKRMQRTTRTWAAYLSQATDVMIALQQETGKTWQQLEATSPMEREQIFNAAFNTMCSNILPDLSDAERDKRRMHEHSYLTFFKLLSKKALLRRTLGKRKRHGQVGQVEEENEGE